MAESKREEAFYEIVVQFGDCETTPCGSERGEQVKQMLESYMRDFQPLTEGEKEMLAKAAEIIHSAITVPCTACRYCVDECPQKIAIPDYFAIYNNLKQFGPGEIIMALNYYASVSAHQGKASDCLECGACEARCPQHLPIREYLKDVAKTLEPKF